MVRMEFESPTPARPRWEWPGFLFLHLTQSVRSDQALKDHLPKEPHSTQTEVQSRQAPSQGELKAGWQESAGLLTPLPHNLPGQGLLVHSLHLSIPTWLIWKWRQNWRISGQTGPGPRPPGSASREFGSMAL